MDWVMFLDKGVRVIPEGALLWEKVLDVPKGHRLCGNLHPVWHWLSFLVREGVHCHSNFTRNSLKKNCQNIPSEFILSNSTWGLAWAALFLRVEEALWDGGGICKIGFQEQYQQEQDFANYLHASWRWRHLHTGTKSSFCLCIKLTLG